MAEFNVGYWDMDAAEYARTVNLVFRLDKLNEKNVMQELEIKRGREFMGIDLEDWDREGGED